MTCPCRFLPVEVRVRRSEGRTNEASQVYGRADYQDAARARGRCEGGRFDAQARCLGSDTVQLEGQFGGMDVSEAKRLRQLEDENAKLKKLLAELGLSERWACSIVSADREMIRYRSCRPPDTELRVQLRELANARKRFGYRQLFVLLRQYGERTVSTGCIGRKASPCASGVPAAVPLAPGRRSCSRLGRMRAGRWILSTTSSLAAGRVPDPEYRR
jgi:hypothetical protein